jgi:peptidoglycan/LPS O-acetylase OafA/YrhL
VVIVHCRALYPEWLSHPQINLFFDTFFDPTEGNGTVLFLFIGGFLFQYLTHTKFDFGKYIQQKFKVIILPYLLISVPLIILRLNTDFKSLSLPRDFNEQSVVFKILYFISTGSHMPPFWFIATIALFYLSAPLLRLLDTEKFYKYFFPFVFAICLFTYRPEHNANPFFSYIHYIPIYITGMWASFYRDKITGNSRGLLYISAFVYFGLSVMDLTGITTLSRDINFEDVLSERALIFNVYIFKAVVLCFMLTLLLYQLREKHMPWIELLGNYSFGIFFVHYIFISVSREILEKTNVVINFSAPVYLAYFFFILLSSIVTVYFIKKWTGNYSRYLIGS